MIKRYELGKIQDLRLVKPSSSFFAIAYNPITEAVLANCEDESLEGLAAKVSHKLSLTLPLEREEVRSISTRSIKDGIGKFPVSNEELIEFYNFLGCFGEPEVNS